MCGKLPSTHSEQVPVSGRKYLLLAGLILIYAVFFLQQFLSDPLGQVPVLDARENLAWAERIASDELPTEPFYRALLYPWVISWMPNPQILAPVLGVFCHLLNAMLCGLIAMQLWRNSGAAWLSGLIYGAYPVSLFFAVQILDITFALMLFLLGLLSLLRIAKLPSWVFPVLAGVMAGLTVLTRPNFLPPALLFPLLACGLSYIQQKKVLHGVYVALMVAVPMLLLFVAQGTINKRLSGEFRILPWQGAYNLYAANREGANGKYYKQSVVFDDVPAGMNPTRMESVYLYRQVHQEASPSSEISAMNAFWREELAKRLAAEPLEWLHLMLRKVAYLINDWEQYNNLSYPFHKERLSWLAWNPLGWGLFSLGSVIAITLGWQKMRKVEAGALGLLMLAYAAGLLLFFVSARFRLPLAPLLAVLCGGLVTVNWRDVSLQRGLFLCVLLPLCGALVYGNWFDARSRDTFRQDQLLLAKAALVTGDDRTAVHFSGEVLSADPSLDAAKRVRVAALFNLWMQLEGGAAEEVWSALTHALDDVEQSDAAILFIKGVVLWREGRLQAAKVVWESAHSRYGPSAASSINALEWCEAEPTQAISPLAQEVGKMLER